MSSLFELKGVSKEYGSGATAVKVLNGINLSVEEMGSIVAIVGPSGSGKTTLLNLLGALDKSTTGEVVVLGSSLGEMPGKQLTEYRRQKVGFVFQTFNLIPNLSALENVALPMEFLDFGAKQARNRGMYLLEQVGIGHRAKHTPAKLSGGEQQRVAIARALANNPELILADEPTGNLDTSTGEEVVSLLTGLVKTEGKNLLVVTHDERLASLADFVWHIRDGQIVP
jgi:ABC-type lipoprotein export system ATPase subunit